MKTEACVSCIIYRKEKAFFSFLMAPPRGVMRLFHRKSVINSKNCFLNGFFARNLQNPGLNRQKQQNLRFFTNKCTPQQATAFFTFMSRVSDINSTRLTIDYYSGIVIGFMRIINGFLQWDSKRFCTIKKAGRYTLRESENTGRYKYSFFRCAKSTCAIPATSTCAIPATYIILFYMCGRLFKGD